MELEEISVSVLGIGVLAKIGSANFLWGKYYSKRCGISQNLANIDLEPILATARRIRVHVKINSANSESNKDRSIRS